MLKRHTDFENTLLLKVWISKNVDQNALREVQIAAEIRGILGGCDGSDTVERHSWRDFEAFAKKCDNNLFCVVILVHSFIISSLCSGAVDQA